MTMAPSSNWCIRVNLSALRHETRRPGRPRPGGRAKLASGLLRFTKDIAGLARLGGRGRSSLRDCCLPSFMQFISQDGGYPVKNLVLGFLLIALFVAGKAFSQSLGPPS